MQNICFKVNKTKCCVIIGPKWDLFVSSSIKEMLENEIPLMIKAKDSLDFNGILYNIFIR